MKLTQEQADTIVSESRYDAMLDGDFEISPNGYVYGLEDGSSVVVSFRGELSHVTAQ